MRRLPLTDPQENMSLRESASSAEQPLAPGMAASAEFIKSACETTIALNFSVTLNRLFPISAILSKSNRAARQKNCR